MVVKRSSRMGNASGCRKSQGTLEDEGGLWKKVFGGKIETPCFT